MQRANKNELKSNKRILVGGAVGLLAFGAGSALGLGVGAGASSPVTHPHAIHHASRGAAPLHATLTSDTTSCLTSAGANPIYVVACNTGLAADALQQQMALQSQQLNQAALSNGASSGLASINPWFALSL